MSEFGAAAELEVEVDRQSLAKARKEIESEMGDVSVGVSAGGGGRAGGLRSDGGASIGDLADEVDDQTEVLEDILEEVKTGGAGGGGGGGGGGIVNRIVQGGATGGVAGGVAGGAGGGGILGSLFGGATTAGAAGIGGLLGLGGTRILDEFGVQDAARGAGETARDLPGGEVAGDTAQLLPGLSLGTAANDLARGDFSFPTTRELFANRADVAGNIGDAAGDTVDGLTPGAPDQPVAQAPGQSTRAPGVRDFTPQGSATSITPTNPTDPNTGEQLTQTEFRRRINNGTLGQAGGGTGDASGDSGVTTNVTNDVTLNLEQPDPDQIRREIDNQIPDLIDQVIEEVRRAIEL